MFFSSSVLPLHPTAPLPAPVGAAQQDLSKRQLESWSQLLSSARGSPLGQQGPASGQLGFKVRGMDVGASGVAGTCIASLTQKIIRNEVGDEGLDLGLGFCVSCGEDLSKQDRKVPPQGSDLPGFEGLRSCHPGCGKMGGAGAASIQECLCASPGPAPMAKEVRTPTMRRSCISTVSCHLAPA